MAAPDPIDAVLAPGGALARAIAGYEHRPEQIAMAHKVRDALAQRRFLLAEAGTGTGKTLAYLVPAILSGRKVVVATATRNLQQQVVRKDLPLVARALGFDVRWALMQGRQNYLCKLKFEQFDGARSFRSRAEAALWPRLKKWAAKTATGDRAEADLPDDFSTWGDLSTPSAACLGSACADYDDCFVTRMRERARAAEIVVVNHHLFFADLVVRDAARGAPGAEVIPPYQAVIFDEAHALEDVATEFFAIEVSPLRIADLARDAAVLLAPGEERSTRMLNLLEKAERLAAVLLRDVAAAAGAGDERGVRLLAGTLRPFADRATEVEVALGAARGLLGGSDDATIQALARRAGEIQSDLAFVRRADDPSYVYWVEMRARAPFLKAAPVDVAAELRSRLYARIDTAVFTSATLTAEGRFDYVRRRLGISDTAGVAAYPTDTIALDSPFDFGRQAVLYAPGHLPDPSDPGFVAAAADEIERLCAITGGRAFALFTSLKNMRGAHRALKDRLSWRVLLQGERPKHRLLEAFVARPSVLFASHSFWEGVDVPGEALSLVIIDRLPFASPADPLVAGRIDFLRGQERDPFAEYQLPQAVLALRQGFGRLIRTRTDRGIVAVLDRRLVTRPYGRVFVESLPRCERFGRLAEIAGWWRRGAALP